MHQSEVARLRQQIESQMEAMQRGMQGFASSSARHAFIRARMDRIDEYQHTLTNYIGQQDTDQLLYTLYTKVMQ
ncbi:MAG TPA: hypothetical protein VNE38_21745 [Ktedonobacteraceae bacterium]|nr:hypothetical protein [Ktedonobacteraceae bacterium]